MDVKNKIDSRRISGPWSISGKVNSDIRAWRSNNEAASRLQYSFGRRFISAASHRPVLHVAIFSLLFLLSGLVSRIGSAATLQLLGAGWKTGDWVGYFQTLWQVQATVVGLVYPFVISFVTFLLQRRASATVQLQIYLSDSGALVAGLSSFALALAMPVQYMLLVHFPLFGEFRWAVVDTLWFLANGFMTLWFLFRTVAFIRPDQQDRIVTQYAVTVALPAEVENRLGTLYLLNAQEFGWLPGLSYAAASKVGQPAVSIGFSGYDKGVVQVSRLFPKRAQFKDVRLPLLRLAISGWLKRATRHVEIRPRVQNRRTSTPILFFPLALNREFEDGEVTICRVENGPDISRLERFLMRISIRFSTIGSGAAALTAEDILTELASDARAALMARDANAFEAKYDELVALHRTLLRVSLVPGQVHVESYALLESRNFPFVAMHVGWRRPYIELAKAAVEFMPSDVQSIKRLCYVARHVCNASPMQEQPLQVRTGLLRISVDIFNTIGEWWLRKTDEHLANAGGPGRKLRLPGALGTSYESVSTYVVGAWEATREDLISLPRDKGGQRSEVWKETLSLGYSHLEQTSLLMLSSVNRGDECQAEWFADTLGKWWRQTVSLHTPSYFLLGKTDFITIDDVPMDRDEISTVFQIQATQATFYREQNIDLPSEVCFAAMQNAWQDVELVSILTLVSWAASNPASAGDSLALHIARGWVSGRAWHEGGDGSIPGGPTDARMLLTAFVRQQVSGSFRSGYRGRLDTLLTSAAALRRAEMVPGRIYSGFGLNSVEELIDAQLILLVVFSNADWRAGASLNQQLAAWTNQDFEKSDEVRRLLNTMLERLKTNPVFLQQAVCENLIAARHWTHTIAVGVERVVSVLQELLESVGEHQVEAEATAPISNEKLSLVATAASASAFAKQTGGFPLSVFQRVSYRQEEAERFTLNLIAQRRGTFTEPVLAPQAINEGEFLADTVGKHASLVLLNDVIRTLPVRSVQALDEESYWEIFKFEISQFASSGNTPILLVANAAQPGWLFEWLYNIGLPESTKPVDMYVRQASQNEFGGPMAYLNDVAVYVAPIPPNETWVMALEVFDSVEFREFAPGVFVDVALVASAAASNLVDVQISFERTVIANPQERLRIVHNPNGSR